MKSKTTFTVEECNDIIRLIEEKLKSDSEGQKAIRRKIRDKGFYWSDFYSKDTEYNVENFIRLKDEGKIFISDEADSADDIPVMAEIGETGDECLKEKEEGMVVNGYMATGYDELAYELKRHGFNGFVNIEHGV